MIARFGRFTLDETRRQLLYDAATVHLTPKAFDLLALLASEAPRVVSKTELHERLWPSTFVSDATLSGLVKEVRRALDDRDTERPVIRTVHRIGYAFCADLAEVGLDRPSSSWHWLVLRGRRAALQQGENVIGRDPQSHVWLDAAGVSRRHARLVIRPSGAEIEDLGSKNGTLVGNAAVRNPVALRDGDRIKFGSVVGVYRTSTAGMSTETQRRDVRREEPNADDEPK